MAYSQGMRDLVFRSAYQMLIAQVPPSDYNTTQSLVCLQLMQEAKEDG